MAAAGIGAVAVLARETFAVLDDVVGVLAGAMVSAVLDDKTAGAVSIADEAKRTLPPPRLVEGSDAAVKFGAAGVTVGLSAVTASGDGPAAAAGSFGFVVELAATGGASASGVEPSTKGVVADDAAP